MGLDNGIILKAKVKEFRKIPKWLKDIEEYSSKLNGDKSDYRKFELCYWRKCYLIRRDIIDCLHAKIGCTTTITLDNIDDIKNVIMHRYFTIDGIKSWNTDSMYYWGYSFHTFKQGLIYLYRCYWLKNFMKNHTCKVYFYDSY